MEFRETAACSQNLQPSSSYGSAPGAETFGASSSIAGRRLRGLVRWLESADETDPANFLAWLWFNDFQPRKLRTPALLAWMVLQGLGAATQLNLLVQVSTALSEYEAALATYCSPPHLQHDICIDSSWNLTLDNTLHVTPAGSPFDFKTFSDPSTILIGVEPLPPYQAASWELQSVGTQQCVHEATKPLLTQMETDLNRLWYSEKALACDPLVASGLGRRYTVLRRYGGWTWPREANEWHLVLRLLQGGAADVHVFIIDVRAPHLEDIHGQAQCNFNQALQNFNERNSGRHHGILRRTKHYLMLFLCVSLLFTYVVLHRFYFYIAGDKLLRRIVALKLFLQDLPQQLCIVAFLYSWYAENGLRCQMCLFREEHCGDWDPLSISNLMLIAFAVLSASANQLLLRGKSDLDLCDRLFLLLFRGMLFGISVLPLSIGFYLSALWFQYPGKWSLLVACIAGALPMVMGIVAIFWSPLLCFFRTRYGMSVLDALERRLEPLWQCIGLS